MVGFIIPALAALAGGILSHKGQTSQINQQNQNAEEQHRRDLAEQEQAQRARYDMGRGVFDRSSQGTAARAQISRGLIGRYLSNFGIDPNLLNQTSTPTAYPDFEFAPGGAGPPLEQAGPSWMSAVGSGLSGIAPYLGTGEEDVFKQYMDRIKGNQQQPSGPPVGPIAPLVEGSPEDLDPRYGPG